MAQKTIYLPDSALVVWESAQQELGESMSTLVVDCLTRKIERNEQLKAAKKKGMKRIVVKVADDSNSEVIRKKAFIGRWLVGDLKPVAEDRALHYDGGLTVSAALTQNSAIAVYWENQHNDDNKELKVYRDFDAFKNAKTNGFADNPVNLVFAVAAELDEDFEEELDI